MTAEERALLEKVAQLIVKRDMAAPAVLLLESVGPLGFLGSQLLHALTPLLDLVCSQAELEKMAHLLEKRESVSLLVEMIQKEDERRGQGLGARGRPWRTRRHGDTGI